MKGTETSHAGEPRSTALQFQTNPPEHILVVEDDIFLRRLNTQVLERSGYEVDAAADGAAAWKELNTDSYDLMITDNSMPKVSGVELLKKMRAARMVLPIIMATGALPTKEFARYPWLQPTATLLKPYTGEEMLSVVKKVLREAESSADGSLWFMYRNTKDNNISQAGEPAGATQPCPTSSSPAYSWLMRTATFGGCTPKRWLVSATALMPPKMAQPAGKRLRPTATVF